MPVLLALAEDQETRWRAQGLQILHAFITKCPPHILHNRGIDAVFKEAVFPTLLFLPSLTPEEESAQLLPLACRCLVALAESIPRQRLADRQKFLDKLLRDGIFAAYYHASNYPRIVELLMENTVDVLNCLGIYSLKHFQV